MSHHPTSLLRMPYLRFFALLTLSALLLGLSGLGGVDVSSGNSNTQTRVEGHKVVHLAVLARMEQNKTVASPDNNPGRIPINWLSFAVPAIKTVWRVAYVLLVTSEQRLAPSLTGIVVLQI